jgi:hypothetical protein
MDKFCSKFTQNALFGKYPSKDELSLIISEGVRLIVDLTDAADCLPEYACNLPVDVKCVKYPISDRCVPDNDEAFENLIGVVIKSIRDNEKVYIHCRGGHGRAGVVAAIVLSKLQPELTAEKILTAINEAHNQRTEMLPKWRKMGSPQTKSQKTFVQQYLLYKKT